MDIFPTIVEEAMRGATLSPGSNDDNSNSNSNSNSRDVAPLAPMPVCPVSHAESRRIEWCTEGQSLSPLLRQQQFMRAVMNWTDAAYSQFPRPEHPNAKADLDCQNKSLPIHQCPNKMGYTIR